MFDPQLYRAKAEVEEWKKRDPIPRLSMWMNSAGLLHPDDLDTIERSVEAEVNATVAFAEAGQWEPVEQLTKDVYAGAAP